MPIGEILDMLLHTNHYLFQVLESSMNDKVLQLYIHCILLCCYLNKKLDEHMAIPNPKYLLTILF